MSSTSTSEHKLAAARQCLLEAEATALHALASARSAIAQLEEENRELRRLELKRDTQFYTEAEFAALLKVSKSTISRERKRGKLQPLQVGDQYRYSSLHVEQAHEIFGVKPQSQTSRRRRHGLVALK